MRGLSFVDSDSKCIDDVQIYDGAKIGNNVRLGKGTIVYPNVVVGNNCFIGPYCIIGEPTLGYYDCPENYEFGSSSIGENSIIRSHTVIYENVHIGNHFQSGHRVTIREESRIGNHCSVGTLCDLQGKLKIGNYCRLHSNVHVGQLSEIEDFVWIYPYVVLTNDPFPPMGILHGGKIRKYAQICTSSIVFPGVEIGEDALIGAHTAVRKDVPAERVVVGNSGEDICSVRELRDANGNQIYPWRDYLKENRGFPWQLD